MQKIKTHIATLFALLLAFIVLVSTSGFSIYSHHCSHNNIHNYSIILPAEACNHDTEEIENASCCKVEIEERCCENTEPISEKDDCCSDTEKIIKLDSEILLNHTTPIVKVSESVLLLAVIIDSDFLFNTFYGVKSNLINESPPPITVSEYLSQIQVFLI